MHLWQDSLFKRITLTFIRQPFKPNSFDENTDRVHRILIWWQL